MVSNINKGQALNIATKIILKCSENSPRILSDREVIVKEIYVLAQQFLDAGTDYWAEEKPVWKRCECGEYVNVNKYSACKNGHPLKA